MTEAEAADFKRLCGNTAFRLFLYRMMREAGVFSASTERLEYREGQRALALWALAEVEAAQGTPSPDGLPVLGSIQILTAFAQSASKEKNLGRRSDPYHDLGSGDDDGDGDPE
ncbi:MAG: hypothetical protein ACKO01_08415 [Erythrobacter sp.]